MKHPLDRLPDCLEEDFREALVRAEHHQAIEQALENDQVRRYALLLYKWAERVSLVSTRDREQLITRHLMPAFHSLPLLAALPRRRVIDVGTGAGLPGIPLALSLSDSEFFLIESRRRKITFLRHVVRELGLHNVVIIHDRVENWCPPEPADCVVTRALSSEPRLLTRAARLLAPHGILVHYLNSRQPLDARATYLYWHSDVPSSRLPAARIVARLRGSAGQSSRRLR